MKRLTYNLLSLLTILVLAVGCSKSDAGDDAVSLLRTVPADASSVVVLNIAHTVESLGGSTDGSEIKLSKDLQKTIDESQAIKPEDKQRLKDICAGETGMAMTSVVYFSAARSYLTGLLNDPDKFVAYLEKQTGDTATEENGAKMIGKVAVIGNQFWGCLSGRPDADQLNYYRQLNEKQSYASADAASLLLEPGKVLTYVADVNRSMAYVPNGSYMKIASSLIFKDIAYMAGSADFKKGNFLADVSVLGSDMKPAELLLPVGKIDTSVVKSFGQNGDIYFAAAVPKKLSAKIADLAGSMGGADGNIANVIKSVDGTVAVRANSGFSDAEARIQTNGENFTDFSNLLQNFLGATITRDGDTLTAVMGSKDFSGSITPAQAADMLKGAWIGMVSDGVIARDVTSVVKLSEDKKSLRLDFEAQGGVDAIITAFTK